MSPTEVNIHGPCNLAPPLPRRYLAIPRRLLRGRRPGATRSPQPPGGWSCEGGGRALPSAAAVSPPYLRAGLLQAAKGESGPLPSANPGAAAARASRRQR